MFDQCNVLFNNMVSLVRHIISGPVPVISGITFASGSLLRSYTTSVTAFYQASSSSSYFTLERAAQTFHQMSPGAPVSVPAKITWVCFRANFSSMVVFSVSSWIATSRLVPNDGYMQKLLQLFNSPFVVWKTIL